jgi:hypothetical protein
MNDTKNSLVDDEKNFIVPLVVIGIVVVGILLLAGLFMPNTGFIF